MRSAFRYESALLGYTVRIRVTPNADPIGMVCRHNRRINPGGLRPVIVAYWTAHRPNGEPVRRDGQIEQYSYREDAARALAELVERLE